MALRLNGNTECYRLNVKVVPSKKLEIVWLSSINGGFKVPSFVYLAFCMALGVILCFGLWTITLGKNQTSYFGYELKDYTPTGFLYFLYFAAFFCGLSPLFFITSNEFELESLLGIYVSYSLAVIIYHPMDYLWQNFDKTHLQDYNQPNIPWVFGGLCLWAAILFILPGTIYDGLEEDDPYFRLYGFLFYFLIGLACIKHVLKVMKGTKTSLEKDKTTESRSKKKRKFRILQKFVYFTRQRRERKIWRRAELSREGKKRIWPIPVLIFFILLAFTPLFSQSARGIIRDADQTFTCPDGTVVSYKELLDSGYSIEEFEDNPPSHWCSEAVDWAVWQGYLGWLKYLTFWITPCLFTSYLSWKAYGNETSGL